MNDNLVIIYKQNKLLSI